MYAVVRKDSYLVRYLSDDPHQVALFMWGKDVNEHYILKDVGEYPVEITELEKFLREEKK